MNVAPEARRCGYVFQEHALFGHLRAWQNVAYGLSGVAGAERRARALALLARFGMEALADARPRTLSGGERQRVALARALAVQPGRPAARRAAHRRWTPEPAPRRAASCTLCWRTPRPVVAGDARLRRGGAARRSRRRDRRRPRGSGGHRGTSWPPRPASAFVADFTGAVVLTGRRARRAAHAGDAGRRRRGGEPPAGERARVTVSVYPWEIEILPERSTTARLRTACRCRCSRSPPSAAACGVGLAAPQPLTAEVSEAAVRELGLEPGVRVVASWKAAATRLLAA